VLESIGDGKIQLLLDKNGEQLLSDTLQQQLHEALEQWHGDALQLKISTARLSEETPALRAEREDIEQQQNIEQIIANDPFVQELQNKFGAQVVPGSIKSM
jgi:DNA polymerase-3 subunit gamma/tau